MESGMRALTLALALPLPGDYFPLEGPGVTDQQESVAGFSGHSLLTAFPLKCGSRRRRPMERGASASLWQTCSVTVLQRRVAMKVAGLAVCAAAARGHKLTDEQVPLSLSTSASALQQEQYTIGLELNNSICSVPFRNRWNRWNKLIGTIGLPNERRLLSRPLYHLSRNARLDRCESTVQIGGLLARMH